MGTTNYEFDDQNNSMKSLIYKDGENEPWKMLESYLTDFGSAAVRKKTQADFYSETRRFYKDNYTLEKIISIKQRPPNPEIKTITFFDENGIFYRREYYFHCCPVKNQEKRLNCN